MFFTIKNNTWKWPKPQTKQNRKTNNPLRAAKSPRSCSQVRDELLRVPLFLEIVHTYIQAGMYYVSSFVTLMVTCSLSLLFTFSSLNNGSLANIPFLLCPLLSQSVVSDFLASWTVACQAPLPMGILQARMLEWVAIPSSRGSSQPRD